MSMRSAGENSKQAAAAFYAWHSSRTWDSGHPQIDPWMREVLVALQGALNTIAVSQADIARQVDENTRTIERMVRHLEK